VGLGRRPICQTEAARHDLALAALQPAFGDAFNRPIYTGSGSAKNGQWTELAEGILVNRNQIGSF